MRSSLHFSESGIVSSRKSLLNTTVVTRNTLPYFRGTHRDFLIFKGCNDENRLGRLKSEIQSTYILFNHCDKNFVYFMIHDRKQKFPSAKYIYLNSHPCKLSVLRSVKDDDVTLFLPDEYSRYKQLWAPDLLNVILLPNNLFKSHVTSFIGNDYKIIRKIIDE